MAQVIEHAHEEDEIELFAELRDIVNGELAKLDVCAEHFGGEAGLSEISLVEIDADDTVSSAAFHFDGVVTGVATDVQNSSAGKVFRQREGKRAPFRGGIIAEEMVGRGLDAVEVEIVEPAAEFADTRFD